MGERISDMQAEFYLPLSTLQGEGTSLPLPLGEGWGEGMHILLRKSLSGLARWRARPNFRRDERCKHCSCLHLSSRPLFPGELSLDRECAFNSISWSGDLPHRLAFDQLRPSGYLPLVVIPSASLRTGPTFPLQGLTGVGIVSEQR